jgi:MFS family permease
MRGVQGTGAAIVLPAALSIVMNMFPEGADRNKALGLWGAIGASGATVGLLTGGLLTRYVGWEYIFYLNVPVGVAALALAPRTVPESRLATNRHRYDPLGALTVTGGLLLLAYAITTAPAAGWSSAKTVSLLVVAAGLLASFILIESRVEQPLLPLRMFRSRPVAGANLAGLLLGASFFAFVFLGTLYLQQVLGYSALETGVAWLATSLTSVALAGASQLLVTRIGAAPVMSGGMALIAAGLAWATSLPPNGHFWADIVGPFLITGAGTAFAFIPISIAGLSGVAAADAGLASGLLNTAQQLGGALGVAITSTVATTRTGRLTSAGLPVRVALTGGFHWAFWVCAATAAAAVPLSFLVPRRTAPLRVPKPAPDREPAMSGRTS